MTEQPEKTQPADADRLCEKIDRLHQKVDAGFAQINLHLLGDHETDGLATRVKLLESDNERSKKYFGALFTSVIGIVAGAVWSWLTGGRN